MHITRCRLHTNADIVLSDAWLGAVVCESNMMITMTNNLLCILHDVGYIQIMILTYNVLYLLLTYGLFIEYLIR